MRDLVASVLPTLDEAELPVFVRFVQGKVFPDWSSEKLGVGPMLLYEATAYVAGRKKADVVRLVNETGDAGLAIERLLARRQQSAFFDEALSLAEVQRAPRASGRGVGPAVAAGEDAPPPAGLRSDDPARSPVLCPARARRAPDRDRRGDGPGCDRAGVRSERRVCRARAAGAERPRRGRTPRPEGRGRPLLGPDRPVPAGPDDARAAGRRSPSSSPTTARSRSSTSTTARASSSTGSEPSAGSGRGVSRR